MTTEPMTLRKLVAKLVAQDGESVLDLPITFRMFDGYRNHAFDQLPATAWPYRHQGHAEGNYKGELRFDVVTTGHRLVKERKSSSAR